MLLADLTPNFRAAHEAIKAELITGALLTTPGSSEETQAWWRLLLVDKLLFHKGGDPGESLNAKLRQLFQSAQSGDWMDLIAELLDGAPTTTNDNRRSTEAATAKRIVALAKQNSWRRAVAAARTSPGPDRTLRGWTQLQAYFPSTRTTCPSTASPMPLTEAERASLRLAILRRIRAADSAASAGLHGSAAHLWKLVVRDSESGITMLVLALFERVAVGSIGPDVRRILIHIRHLFLMRLRCIHCCVPLVLLLQWRVPVTDIPV